MKTMPRHRHLQILAAPAPACIAARQPLQLLEKSRWKAALAELLLAKVAVADDEKTLVQYVLLCICR
jgi:hypothetical protein